MATLAAASSSDIAATSTSNSTDTSNHCSSSSSLSGIRAALGPKLLHRITKSKVLLVGAGGIGCELLKNLAQSGFQHVEVIDLDTIDVSNLNRQFLFRKHHVGQPKCQVACEAALAMCPKPINVEDKDGSAVMTPKYIAHHGNVKDNDKFGVSFFKTFDVVLNALDNVGARRHVNRICLASNIPLVEAGTTGYLGQVTVIAKDSNVECYECQPKQTQKVYPICTIRSTPSLPVHTIVWAKELLNLLFNDEAPNQSMLYEDPSLAKETNDTKGEEKAIENGSSNNKNDSDNGTTNMTNGDEEKSSADEKFSSYMEVLKNQKPTRPSCSTSSEDGDTKTTLVDEKAIREYAKNVVDAFFQKEIQKQLNLNQYKTAKKKPFALSDEVIHKGCYDTEVPTKKQGFQATVTWTPEECIAEFVDCIMEAYSQSSSESSSSSHAFCTGAFDKDDEGAMRFVTAASNLRSYQFDIPLQSLHDAKGIAGNIVPAIATTNAIVAGLQLLQVFQLLKLKLDQEEKNESNGSTGDDIKEICRYTYCLRDKTRKGYYLQPTRLPDPNSNCFVCRNSQVDICLNTKEWTLKDFLSKVIKTRLGFVEPSILLGDSQIYEEEAGVEVEDFAINVPKKLIDLPCGGIRNETIVRVEDFSQDLTVDLYIVHRDEWDAEQTPDLFTIGGGGSTPKAASSSTPIAESNNENDNKPSSTSDNKAENGDDDDDDDDIEVVEDSDEVEFVKTTTNSETKKRDAGDLEDDGPNNKRMKHGP